MAIDAIMKEMPYYSFEFEKTFANHAPMVLVALDRIGGSAERLQDFFDHYRDYKHLQPVPLSVEPIHAGNWQGALGDRQREADLNLFFLSEVKRLGADEAIRHYLPFLAGGVGASAFHALMRLAYGLIRRDATEIALSLAYWTATYLTLPPAGGARPMTKEPAVVLETSPRLVRCAGCRCMNCCGSTWPRPGAVRNSRPSSIGSTSTIAR